MTSWLEQTAKDLQYGSRSLLKNPGLSALAILSLATGVMATTVIYSVLHAVVLDPFPYKDVDQLMSVRVMDATQRGSRTYYSVDQFLEIAGRTSIFDGVIASTISDVLWSSEADPQRLRGNHGTFNTFDVMGVPPLIGRTPNAGDARPGAPPVVVLGYRFWQRQFGGDPDVLGRELRLNDVVRTVIGVMPKRFMWRGADVYVPVTFERGHLTENVQIVHLLGRLKPGVSEAQASADLAPIITDLKTREPDQFPDKWRVGLLSFKETFPSGITSDIWVLFGAVALLLVIACANVSNLLLSKATARQREMTVRAALGASRGRLVRQLLTESLILALVAGAVGVLLAYTGLPAILALVPPGTIPDESEIALNTPVLIFTLGLSIVTSVLCGLAPAHSSGRDVAQSMREAGRGLAGTSSQAILRKGLVVAEVALSLMLLAGSSLLVRTFVTIQNVDLGVPPNQILTMRVPLAASRYPDATHRVQFFRELTQKVSAIPGVAAVGVNTGLHPFGNMRAPVDIAGTAPRADLVQIHHVDDGYLNALGIRLVSGRLLTGNDVNSAQHVVLVNERFVKNRLDGRSPLGQVVSVPRLRRPPFALGDDAFQIVGVVRDTFNQGLANPVIPEVYVPYTVAGIGNILVVRAQGDPAAITRTVVSQVYAIDRNQPVASVQTLDALLKTDEYATPRFNLALLGAFAVLGVVLAIVGVYGVMSSAVAQQTPEIGVRMALGASSADILRMVVGRGSRLLLIGMALGLIGSVGAARFLARQIWNVPAFDPLAFGIVSLALFVAGLQACFWPARRASRIDPLIALRQD
jgi:putative ABC transport system permease protein